MVRRKRATKTATIVVEPVVSAKAPRRRARRIVQRALAQNSAVREVVRSSNARKRNPTKNLGFLGSGPGNNANTLEGEAVLRLAVDPFTKLDAKHNQFGWPDGVNVPSLSPHFYGEMMDINLGSGTFSGVTPLVPLANATVWNYIQCFDPDVAVLSELFYQGSLDDMIGGIKVFRTQRTEYGLKVLNESGDYTASRLWSVGFTTEFSGTITTDSGKSTVVQFSADAKLVGPSGTPSIFRYYVNLLGNDDPTVADPSVAATMLTETLPNTDDGVFRTEAKLGHCSVLKLASPELPYNGFKHSRTGAASEARYYNPLYVAFYGTAETPVGGTGSVFVNIPFDIPANRQHTLMIAHYQGLNPQGSFRVKTYEYAECTIAPSSILQPFTKRGLLIDRMCMDEVASIHSRMPSAFPSSYNFFDKIWKGIKSAGKWLGNHGRKVGNIVKPFLPPEWQAPIRAVEGATDQIIGLLGNDASAGSANSEGSTRYRRSLSSRMAHLAVMMLFLFAFAGISFAQPQQVIVCNSPTTPGICGPNLPVFTSDSSVVEAILGLGEGEFPILDQINKNLCGSSGECLTSIASFLSQIFTQLTILNSKLDTGEFDGEVFLKVGLAAQQVNVFDLESGGLKSYMNPAVWYDPNGDSGQMAHTAGGGLVYSKGYSPLEFQTSQGDGGESAYTSQIQLQPVGLVLLTEPSSPVHFNADDSCTRTVASLAC